MFTNLLDYLTIEQCADRLNVSTRHIRRMIDAGKLKHADVGIGDRRCIRIPVVALPQLAGLSAEAIELIHNPPQSPVADKPEWLQDLNQQPPAADPIIDLQYGDAQ